MAMPWTRWRWIGDRPFAMPTSEPSASADAEERRQHGKADGVDQDQQQQRRRRRAA